MSPAEGRRGVGDAYTRVDGPRKASVEAGTRELAGAAYTGERTMMLELTPEVEETHSRIPEDGETVKSAPDLQIPN
jgi:hypothetical protein